MKPDPQTAAPQPGRTPRTHVIAARDFVMSLVAVVFSVPVNELLSRQRCAAPIAFARQVAMYLCHVVFRMPLAEVGTVFGRDRSTAAHACHVVEDARDDPFVNRRIELIEQLAGTVHIKPKDEGARHAG